MNQLPSFTALGRWAALPSVLGIVAVAVLCVTPPLVPYDGDPPATSAASNLTLPGRILTVSASFGGVTFAVSPTLVMLNTRHAMARTERLPSALLLAVGSYCAGFIVLILAAGESPPKILFDLVPSGVKRRATALLLFAHVAVSYTISSVALCSAAERFLSGRMFGGEGSACEDATVGQANALETAHETAAAGAAVGSVWRARAQWAVLTNVAMCAAWLLANAAPFFDGLTDLIGSICFTSFFLPALLYRQAVHAAKNDLSPADNTITALLMVMAVVMTLTGLTGAITGIVDDWSRYGPSFACHAV